MKSLACENSGRTLAHITVTLSTTMFQVNKVTATKLRQKHKAEEELRKRLQIHSKRHTIEVSPQQVDMYFKKRDNIFELFRTKLQFKRLKTLPQWNNAKVPCITIRVPQQIDLADLFKLCDSKAQADDTFLFRELDDQNRIKWLTHWNIEVEAITGGKLLPQLPYFCVTILVIS